jgi:putative heme-binding domain-containing protein
MAAPATSNELIEVVRKSKQIESGRLDAYLSKQTGQALPSEPRKLAALLVRDGLLTAFQAEQFLQGKYKGFSLGGYRLIDRIGRGGTGKVYLAEHEVMRRRVALKVLAPALANDTPALERFRREAQAVAALNHPNIVRANDFLQEGAVYFLVMEYVDGPSLQTVLQRQGALPIEVACEYIRQAAIGLQHAHEANLVHRDIKPANLLVTAEGVVKILDLGLARFAVEGQESLTKKFDENTVMGTADYLAPEQALDLHDVDARGDIYSLGATFYALLAGAPPFPEGTAAQKLLWHQMRVPAPIHVRRTDVPAELSHIITTLMDKVPQRRVQSCAEVAALLEPWCLPARQGGAASTARHSRPTPLATPSVEPPQPDHGEEPPVRHAFRARDVSRSATVRGILLGTALLSGLMLLLWGVLVALFWGAPGSSTRSSSEVSKSEATQPSEEVWPTESLLAERRQVVAQLLSVTKNGADLARGKGVYKEHCGRCHTPPPGGARIGPDLREYAAHSEEDLLTLILVPRPSRDVLHVVSEVTTKEGQVFTGVVVPIDGTSIEVVDVQARRTRLQRSGVAKSVLSRRSLMPHDFEKRLKPAEVADLLAFLKDTGKFRPLPLAKVATAVSTRGMFYSEASDMEQLAFPDWKPKWFEGVPFVLTDPLGAARNNVVLLHSPRGSIPPTMPKSVRLACNSSVKAVHLLGGVSGWGFPFPAIERGSVSMVVRLRYTDGKTEDHPLKNGEHLADYINRVDVPGSRFAFDLGGRQLRYLAIQAERNDQVEAIEFIKGPDETSPVVMAVTVEVP